MLKERSGATGLGTTQKTMYRQLERKQESKPHYLGRKMPSWANTTTCAKALRQGVLASLRNSGPV